MVLQMCIMALRMTGSLVGSTWCLQETNPQVFALIPFLSYYCFPEHLLYEDLHDGSADLHPHTVLLEHIQERQETLLENIDSI